MTLTALHDRAFTRLDEDPADPKFWQPHELTRALNRGQRLFVLLTLCLEATEAFPLDAATTFYHIRPTLPTFMLPLRVRLASGAKVRPARLEDLDALDSGWQASPGAPVRYACLGFDFLALYHQPAGLGTSLSITHARTPTQMVHSTDVPEIPEPQHQALVDYAHYEARIKEGGDEFLKGLGYLGTFLEAAAKVATYTRARALAQRYDHVPFELESFDRSKLLNYKNPRGKPPWLTASQLPQAAAQ